VGTPLKGIRVVELGVWVAAPSAGALLADWGADVIKIEAPDGDPYRWVYVGGKPSANAEAPNPPFEFDNRGKRSIAVDVGHERGIEIVRSLIAGADVFITNLRPAALRKWGLDYDSLRLIHPALVMGLITGYGTIGPDADKPVYDVGAFWARTGMAASLVPPGAQPPLQRAGMGDHLSGMSLTAGICAALVERASTGVGQLVTTSLMRVGLYSMAWDASAVLRLNQPVPTGGDRMVSRNPAFNLYRDSEGRWFWLLGLEGERHWPRVARAVGHPEWLEDARYSTFAARVQHALELVSTLDGIFGEHPIAHWTTVFDQHDVWWSPVLTVEEALREPQVLANGTIVEAPVAEGTARVLSTPVDFNEEPCVPAAPCPEAGQHTEEILLELGHDWDTILELKDLGVTP
jgi:crotonobetainyl-CoA:carnitine CoA-transferase CaiB-like acyl-CoA transferase